MSILKQIDFINHDGVNQAMINDFMRNQFYDNILKDNVRDQHCIDVGFGTGLLSILALKHGARSIIAYESDNVRYELGKLIIEKLRLTKKIKLVHRRFDYQMLELYPDVTVVFSETVNGNLWNEGLFTSLPRHRRINFLPGQYFLNMYACVVPDSFAQGLIAPKIHNGFNPGVDIDTEFVNLINELGFPGHTVSTVAPVSAMYPVDPGADTEWGWIPYLRLCVNNGSLITGYCLDVNDVSIQYIDDIKVPIDFAQENIKLHIDVKAWRRQSVILIPRAGMRHGNYQLMLDTGHWGPTFNPVVLTRPTRSVSVTHSLHSGLITYTTD